MAVGDIFEITDVSNYFSQEMVNVYHVRQNSNPSPTIDPLTVRIANAFVNYKLPAIRAIQTLTLTHTAIRVRNLFDPTQASEVLINLAGSRSALETGELYSQFVALSHQFRGDNANIRVAQKRFAGFGEAQLINGTFNNASGFIGFVAALGIEFLSGLDLDDTVGGIPDFSFCTVKRMVEDTVKGKVYSLPTNVLDAEYDIWEYGNFKLRATTQNSRKED